MTDRIIGLAFPPMSSRTASLVPPMLGLLAALKGPGWALVAVSLLCVQAGGRFATETHA
jgi:hypothetical protein